jgi:hypothetical protein
MPTALAGIGLGANVLGSIFSGTPKTTTTTSQTQQHQSQQSESANNQWWNVGAGMDPLYNSLLSYGQQSMTDPSALLNPIRNAGLQNINLSYNGVPQQIANQMASRGYGSSGPMGNAMVNANLARAGSVSNLEGQMAQSAVQQQQFGANLSSQLLNAFKGSSSNAASNSSGDSTSNTKGTSTTPNTMLQNGLLGFGSGLSNLAGLMTLKNALNPGSSETATPTNGMPPMTWGDWGGEY